MTHYLLHLFALTWAIIAGATIAYELSRPRETVFQRTVVVALFTGALVVYAIGIGMAMMYAGRMGGVR